MRRSMLFLASACGAAVLALPAAADEFVYQLDDGAPDFSFNDPFGNYVTMNTYRVAGGNRLIGAVDVGMGPNPSGIQTICVVFSDPNQDGVPLDATPLGFSSLQLAGFNTIQRFLLPTPVDVGPDGTSFFVGVYSTELRPNLHLWFDERFTDGVDRVWWASFLEPADPYRVGTNGGGALSVAFLLSRAEVQAFVRAVAVEPAPAPGDPADFNADGTVDVFDLIDFLVAFAGA